MTDRANRREAIIQVALRLFVEQGYTATSVRQIAEAVGVTEAALYYHFKDGKRALLQAVVEDKLPDMLALLEDVKAAESLYDLAMRFGRALEHLRQQPLDRDMMRWIVAEFPKLSNDERAIVRHKQTMFQRALREQVQRFVPVAATADQLAWTMMCTGLGYGQLFVNLELIDEVDFPPDTLATMLARLVACAFEPQD